MPQIPLVFGSGLDRETGVMAMEPGGMEDLRNVHLLQGKFQVRRGFERVFTFTDPEGNDQTDVLGGIAMRGRRAAVYVTYDRDNYKVNVWVGDATGTWVQFLAEWPFLKPDTDPIQSADNPDPPVVILAEYNSIVFLAHSMNRVTWRAQTHFVYYDEDDAEYKLEGLVAAWEDPMGTVVDQEVRFRGVTKHLDYMVGWGWGDAFEDRPEIVRISQPGVPVEDLLAGNGFDALHYWLPGDEGDPVISCLPAAETLLCFKESETWELYGDSSLDFGQRRLDALFGMLQPRLAVNVEGSVFAWTNEGPRMFAPDGTSMGLEIPLELTLPEPFDLVMKGDDKYAFAVYMPVYRSVWWIFNRRVYSLYIRVDGDWKWGYQELGFDAMCGFRLPQSGWGLAEPPTGYPSSPTMNDITDTTADVVVTNNNQDGDETLEVWLKKAGGAWELHKSFPVSVAASQEHTLEDLSAGWDYDLATRYRRGPYYTFGYESSDPEAWPAGCKTSFTTTMATLPTINSLAWARTSASSERIRVSVTPPYTGTGYELQVRRGGVLVQTYPDVSGAQSFDDTGCSPEAVNEYDCRLVTAYVTGAYTSVSSLWAGPVAPTLLTAEPLDSDTYYLTWANGMSAYTEVYDSLPSELEADVMDNLRWTSDPGENDVNPEIPGSTGLTPWVAVRHKVTAYTVTDYSNISKMQLSGPIT